MPPRAVLFDFDGVIADTENHHVAAWERTFGAMGWDVSPETCARAAEVDDRIFLAEVFASRSVSGGDIDGWVARKQDLTRQMLADAPRLYPGVAELIGRLAGRVKLAVVSTTWRENILVTLGAAGLIVPFDAIVGKEDVAEPKPDPASYRLALAELGVVPRDAVALEDSPTGLAAANAAGVRVVAVGHRRPPGDWAVGAPYVPDLASPDEVLAALGLA